MSSIIERIISRMEEASNIFGRNGDHCPFARFFHKLNLGKLWYESELAVSTTIGDLNKEANARNASLGGTWNEDFWLGSMAN
jgi:hypothetical protein